MKCSHCANDNPGDASFCENCGNPLNRACPSCGKDVSPSAKFCKHCGMNLATLSALPAFTAETNLSALQKSAPLALQEKMRQASANIEGERKQVTILFTDIVNSTLYAERFDPEDWREIVSGAHQIVSEAVYHYEGTIAQLLGDGVLAFFGAPITHEDDPLRAIQTGLDIQSKISAYAQRLARQVPDFQVRIGINTGTVVVGNIGHDMHMEYLAIGDVVNLAARLQSAAKPGKILISDQMLRSVQHAVDVRDLGEVNLKGKAETVHIYQVEGIRFVPGRGRGMRDVESPFVGKQAELKTLRQVSAAVQAGLGRMVVLTGEPGIGKSRLLAEWRRMTSSELRWVECATLSYGQGLPHHLLVDLLRSLLSTPIGAEEPEINRALANLVAELFGPAEVETYAFLGQLLSLRLNPAAHQVLRGLDPLTLRTQSVAALRRLLLALAERQPLALIFEDIHWADQASVDALTQTLSLARQAALLFCFTTRLEQDTPGWGLVTTARRTLGAGLVEINLQPLSEEDVGHLVANLLASGSLPLGLQAYILEKTEGNPLYIEEVINALIEADVLALHQGQPEPIHGLAKVDIPDNLKRLLLARIDRLAEGPKRTLRVASVLGREFLVRLLDAVLSKSGQAETRSRLLDQLSDLEATSLIQLASTRPEIGYLFRHTMIQEAAYEAILKADRQRLHRAAAMALEQLYSDQLDEMAAILAYHFERAQDRHHALVYLEIAADRARQKYANAEATSLYRAALEQAEALHQSGEANVERVAELYEKLGNVQLLAGLHEAGRASLEQAVALTPTDQGLVRARRIRQVGNGWMPPREYGKALKAFDQAAQVMGEPQVERNPIWQNEWLDLQLDRLWALYWMNDVHGMNDTIQRIQPMIEATGSSGQRSIFYGRLVTLAFRRDRYVVSDETLQYAQLAKQFAEQSAHETGELTNLMLSPFIIGFTYLWRGNFAEAETNFGEALELAERTGNQEQRVLVLSYRALLHRLMQDLPGVQEFVPHALQAAQDANMPVYIGLALANQAWISLQQGDPAKAEMEAKAAQVNIPPVFPHYGVVAWPLIAIYLPRGEASEAVKLARLLVHPSQRKLDDELESSILAAIQYYDSGDAVRASEQLGIALKLAQEHREGIPTPSQLSGV